jgi:hypothetical protein
MIEMIPVDSTWISAYGYDEAGAVVYVAFRREGVRWQYRGVPSHVWQEFQLADSKGQFIHRVLESFDHGPA